MIIESPPSLSAAIHFQFPAYLPETTDWQGRPIGKVVPRADMPPKHILVHSKECWNGGSIESPTSLSAAILFPVPDLFAGNHRSTRSADWRVRTTCGHATEAYIGTYIAECKGGAARMPSHFLSIH